jgi:hypothetical protein
MSCEQEMHPKPVRHNPEQHRFAMDTPNGPAVADYRLEGNFMTIYHTRVPVHRCALFSSTFAMPFICNVILR